MLEVIAVIALYQKLAKMAGERGRSAALGLLGPGLWIGGEILVAMIAALAGARGLAVYVFALLGALAGGFASFQIVRGLSVPKAVAAPVARSALVPPPQSEQARGFPPPAPQSSQPVSFVATPAVPAAPEVVSSADGAHGTTMKVVETYAHAMSAVRRRAGSGAVPAGYVVVAGDRSGDVVELLAEDESGNTQPLEELPDGSLVFVPEVALPWLQNHDEVWRRMAGPAEVAEDRPTAVRGVAGFCSECRANVWLQNGRCINGHDADKITGVYEVQGA